MGSAWPRPRRDHTVADELAHHTQPARARHRPRMGSEITGDDPEQGGLAGAVRPDQRDLRALADAERDVVEQHPTVRELVPDTGDIDMTHERSVWQATPARRPDYCCAVGSGMGTDARSRCRTSPASAPSTGRLESAPASSRCRAERLASTSRSARPQRVGPPGRGRELVVLLGAGGGDGAGVQRCRAEGIARLRPLVGIQALGLDQRTTALHEGVAAQGRLIAPTSTGEEREAPTEGYSAVAGHPLGSRPS